MTQQQPQQPRVPAVAPSVPALVTSTPTPAPAVARVAVVPQAPVKLRFSRFLLVLCLLQCVVWSLGVAAESSQQYYRVQNEFLAKGHLNLVNAQELSQHRAHFQRLATAALIQQLEEWAAHLSLLQRRSLERGDPRLGRGSRGSAAGGRRRANSSSAAGQDLLRRALQRTGGAEAKDANANANAADCAILVVCV